VISAPELPPGYYLDDFETVLRDVAGRYGDLLHPGERERLAAFAQLPLGARRIYVRMLTRQGPWFRPEQFHYPEIEDLPGALAALAAAGFCSAEAPLEALVALLRKDELVACLRQGGVPCRPAQPREQLAALVLQAGLRPDLAAVAPLGQAWVRLIFFLFFGNGEQDLTDFVLAGLGRIQYEAYPVDPGERLFQARADVDFLLTLRELREAFEQAADAPALEALTALLLAMDPHPGVRQQRRFHRLLNEVGRAWERQARPDRALACYALSERPPARERTVRLLAAGGDLDAAREAALAMAAAPLEVAEERFARQYLRRAARRDPLAAQWLLRHPDPEPVPEVRLTLPRHPSGSVEQAALEAARREGWDGLFTENALWRGLFGLAFWDVLFAPVPGAFQHRLQAAPADLGSPAFFARRKEAFERRFLELEAGPGSAILAMAQAKRGLANVFVSWRHLPQELLATALEALPPAAVLSVLRAMAPNPLAFDNGFPDLFLFRAQAPRVLLWEVKGPGDALRPEQERWLTHFNRAGVQAAIAWVKYLD